MKEMSDLKPCPFCGAIAHMWEWNGGVAIQCSRYNPSTHQVQIMQKKKGKAIEAWNRRADDDSD